MTTKSRFVKLTIIFILIFFVLVTGLSMIVPYIGKDSSPWTWDIVSWDVNTQIVTWTVVTGDTETPKIPEITKEEASKKIQQLLSGVTAPKK